eukprot:CAMPEP_0201561092 /NCGR_PEP_ID=MMETSP0173_2-20130828/78613_1 /ASSEMBLY_ACC=CAM_ASM_000268 /TAXON_ID=218659 /ORGANISM="Vexillifera sp., Strain DIVA3 564/2" /LENGTH=396 /DNA_ID=CAMNT_0047975569 /DNA_START=34 /DNA_END=1224 /DNA_ORIENTATION=-
MYDCLFQRELHGSASQNQSDPAHFIYNVAGQRSLVERLSLSHVFRAHQGCVNSVNWSADGELLVSGSDEGLIAVWNYQKQPYHNEEGNHSQLQFSFSSGHRANIFCTRFLPQTSSQYIISCSADNQIRLFNTLGWQSQVDRLLATPRHSLTDARARRARKYRRLDLEPTKVYRCHTDRTKKLATSPIEPQMFWSVSEDSTIRQFDLRTSHQCYGGGRGSLRCSDTLLVDLGPADVELFSIAVNPANPMEFCAGGSDGVVRVYDRRMLSSKQNATAAQRRDPLCAAYFSPKNIADQFSSAYSFRGHITGVNYSLDGREIVASFSHDHIYTFRVNDTQQYANFVIPDLLEKHQPPTLASSSTTTTKGLYEVYVNLKKSPRQQNNDDDDDNNLNDDDNN